MAMPRWPRIVGILIARVVDARAELARYAMRGMAVEKWVCAGNCLVS